MHSSAYRHRQVWRDWLDAHSDEPIDLDGVYIECALDTRLLPDMIAERQLVVDSISDEGYHALLIATYSDDELVSLILDDDEGTVGVLYPGAD